MNRIVWWFLYLLPAALVVATILLLTGCATEPIRLGPGDCLVLTEKREIIVAGQDCNVRRIYR